MPLQKNRNSCKYGCIEFHKEQKVCGTHVHADPEKAKHHARILAEEHRAIKEEEDARNLNDKHEKINEEMDKAHARETMKPPIGPVSEESLPDE